MMKKLKFTISNHQRNILTEEVQFYILNEDIEKEISNSVSKNGKFTISLTPEDLEELIGNICFVCNHEEENENMTMELDELIDYLECVLEEG